VYIIVKNIGVLSWTGLYKRITRRMSYDKSVRLYLQLFVGGLMSSLRYLCVWCPTHTSIELFFLFCLSSSGVKMADKLITIYVCISLSKT
jgi:hypothetical protein